jgi:hypothetical protein
MDPPVVTCEHGAGSGKDRGVVGIAVLLWIFAGMVND